MRPRIVISCGDVNGIGIECLVGALRSSPFPADLELCIDANTLSDVLREHQLDATCEHRFESEHKIDATCERELSAASGSSALVVEANGYQVRVPLVPIGVTANVHPGMCAADSGAVAITSLNTAVARVVSGEAHGILTLPISKDACKKAGWPYPGHTEMLAERAGGVPLMLLTHENVRVGLATTHIPLRYVAASLTTTRVEERIRAMHSALTRDFGIAAPHIAVLGLNPHAGEEGLIGSEEQTIIGPTIIAMRERGIDVLGPYPSDGFFAFGAYKTFDGILAMYHDQGLIPLKLLAHGGGVNVTANLNIVRTSPDHGTAFDKAGRNVADSGSTVAALSLAIAIVGTRAKNPPANT
ncbi:MAG: 4-hydroxythreonine-4-phosphate dehydrogenase PdxA [bacterium]|nr:4-hydroxythreonine-4-phosphate dehydrogenase PdxA [bacterium]